MAGTGQPNRSKSDCSTIARLSSAATGFPCGSVVVTVTSHFLAGADRPLGVALAAGGDLDLQVALDGEGLLAEWKRTIGLLDSSPLPRERVRVRANTGGLSGPIAGAPSPRPSPGGRGGSVSGRGSVITATASSKFGASRAVIGIASAIGPLLQLDQLVIQHPAPWNVTRARAGSSRQWSATAAVSPTLKVCRSARIRSRTLSSSSETWTRHSAGDRVMEAVGAFGAEDEAAALFQLERLPGGAVGGGRQRHTPRRAARPPCPRPWFARGP